MAVNITPAKARWTLCKAESRKWALRYLLIHLVNIKLRIQNLISEECNSIILLDASSSWTGLCNGFEVISSPLLLPFAEGGAKQGWTTSGTETPLKLLLLAALKGKRIESN